MQVLEDALHALGDRLRTIGHRSEGYFQRHLQIATVESVEAGVSLSATLDAATLQLQSNRVRQLLGAVRRLALLERRPGVDVACKRIYH